MNALNTKLNDSIQCFNQTAIRSSESYKRYVSWVNEKTGPTCTEKFIGYGLYSLPDASAVCKKAKEEAALAPKLPDFDAAVIEMVTVFEEIYPLTKQASTYYDQGDYKDDACAKAKEMHPKLIEGFQKMKTASEKVAKSLDKIQDELDQKEMAELEKEQGKKLPWQVRSFLVHSKKLVNSIPDSDKDFNSETFLPLAEALIKSANELDEYTLANNEEVSKVSGFSAFDGSAKTFIKQVKEVKRSLAETKKLPANGLSQIINEYNKMINWSNSLRL